MAPDRKLFHSYFEDTVPTKKGVSVVDHATSGQLRFNAKLLNELIKNYPYTHTEDVGEESLRFYRMRASDNRRVYYAYNLLEIPKNKSDSTGVLPIAVRQKTRTPLNENDDGAFIGKIAFEYAYSKKDGKESLRQEIVLSEIISGVVAELGIRRRVLPDWGDMTYGFAVLNDNRIPKAMGFMPESDEPVILKFLPDRVVGVTKDGENVVGEDSNRLLYALSLGLIVNFENARGGAILEAITNDHLYYLQLGKILDFDYYRKMLTDVGEWVTDSGVLVDKPMQGAVV